MCCLFGLLDYEQRLSVRQKNRILSVLATACEARGTDATGIAYNSRGALHIYKKPVPAHQLRMRIPADASVVMGHTRMTTQGNAKWNYNNHPFRGKAGATTLALAHNGVLRNDDALKRRYQLPHSKIQTDSYVAVQLLEQKKVLNFESLRFMAEQLEGSFTITVLDDDNHLYVVKGDNPFCLLHFPRLGFYLYASTEEILRRALDKLRLRKEKQVRIPVDCGEILKLSPDGEVARSRFNDEKLYLPWYQYGYDADFPRGLNTGAMVSPWDDDYLEELKAVAASFGYAPEDIDRLLKQGFSLEDVEDLLYCGEC